MNFFTNPNDFTSGMLNMMKGNGWSAGSQKEKDLRLKLQTCTYPDETKYMIEKAAKQVFHVYNFFNADILTFMEGSVQRRYIELKGILQVEIKGKICKVDYNMMLPFDFPRTPPFVRIVNRNAEYRVDPFYQSLQSKSDISSYVLNQKLQSVKVWAVTSNLVNIIMQCTDLFKMRFPFTKPVGESNLYGGNPVNPWDKLYGNKNTNMNNGGGSGFVPNNTNAWTNPPPNNYNAPQGWGQTNNVAWGQPANNNGWVANPNSSWGTNNNSWDTGNNNWGNNAAMGMGGMGGIVAGMGGMNNNNTFNAIVSAQKLVAKQKDLLSKIKVKHDALIEKNQLLDITKKSLESEEEYLRKQNYEMTTFLQKNDQLSLPDISTLVTTSDPLSEQILNLSSSIKARHECVDLIEGRFSEERISLEQFLKQVRKMEEAGFEEKALLRKCLEMAH